MPKSVRVRRDTGERSRNRLAQKRKRRRIIFAASAGVLLLVLAGVFFYAVRMPEFSIQNITIDGTYAISSDAVQKMVENELQDNGFVLIPKRMVFVYPKAALETMLLKEFPQMREVSLSRDSLLGTTLYVKVTERTSYGIWCTDDTTACYQFDASGFLFAPADAFAESYIFYGGVATDTPPITQYFYPGRMDTLRALLDALSPIGLDPHIVRVMNESDVDIELLGGMHIKVSLNTTPEESISALGVALASDALKDKREAIEYIDIRFGNRVYFKFKGENSINTEQQQ